MKKKFLYFLSFILFIISCFSFLTYFYYKSIFSDNLFKSIEVVSYDENSNSAIIDFTLNNDYSNLKCGYGKDVNSKYIDYKKISNGVCHLEVDLEKLDYVYLKSFIFSNRIKLDNLVLNVNTIDKLYLAVNEKKEINPDVKVIGDSFNISYKSKDEKVVSVDKNKVIGKKKGKTKLEIYVNDNKADEIDVEVTNLIVKRPKKFDKSKPYLPCKKYTLEESKKLDDILKTKIENVGGYGTRAAVVEAMRFLLLDFKYKIDYFFENGRLVGGVNYVDGEGRYYHRGLYLHSRNFDSIEKSLSGPAIWGCPLRNFESYPPKFVEGGYNSNGLDCSGFVSWTIYNGGFDVGDRGAGDSLEDDTELNDVGEKVELTDELINSDKVKAGDILGIWGHIAIIIGIDDDNVYVAESLWTYGGVVINTYDKDKLDDEFVQVVLMDDVYKEDGLYTNMWY